MNSTIASWAECRPDQIQFDYPSMHNRGILFQAAPANVSEAILDPTKLAFPIEVGFNPNPHNPFNYMSTIAARIREITEGELEIVAVKPSLPAVVKTNMHTHFDLPLANDHATHLARRHEERPANMTSFSVLQPVDLTHAGCFGFYPDIKYIGQKHFPDHPDNVDTTLIEYGSGVAIILKIAEADLDGTRFNHPLHFGIRTTADAPPVNFMFSEFCAITG